MRQQRPLHADDVPSADLVAAGHGAQSFSAQDPVPGLCDEPSLYGYCTLTYKEKVTCVRRGGDGLGAKRWRLKKTVEDDCNYADQKTAIYCEYTQKVHMHLPHFILFLGTAVLPSPCLGSGYTCT